MKWPWSKEKTEHEKQLEKLNQQQLLNEAKLKAAEIDEEVLRAVTINNILSQLHAGARGQEERDQRLRIFLEQAGNDFEELRNEQRFKSSIRRLEDLDEETLKKLERITVMKKEHKRFLGYRS